MGLGRTLIIIGLVLVVTGVLVSIGGRFFGLGRLPGDIVVRRPGFTFHFPVMTSIILSVLLTILMWLVNRR
ncbi:MAG TPA: DUF2905 domain-containing protein [Bryobacteraceae bacterium]|nr:DUF2905 domain-containing protein [Bryobacteraceae bacterium]